MGIKVTNPPFLGVNLRLEKKIERSANLIGKKIVSKTKYNLNGRVLQKRTGKLRNSIKYRLVRISDGLTLIIGSDVIYAPVHEKGLRAGRGKGFKMPKRPFLIKAVVDNKEYIRKQLKDLSARILKNG